ncbi:MAG: fasciclin domain-containing protein, partial [Acidimicrobiia bacterium]|nr:fasciclin domain-containing protein [Acidimicrobiia bacterium]
TLDGQSVATVNGAEITVSIDGGTVMVNDATVVATDIEASNGIIHVIDTVLLPPAGE